MAATVAMAMGMGTTAVVTPISAAQTLQMLQKPASEVTSYYEELSPADEQAFYEGQKVAAGSGDLLDSEFGVGWCIDYRLDIPRTDPGSYEVRKLTGRSGNHGDSLAIDPDIQKAAIAVTKKMIADNKAGNAAAVN